MTRMHEDARIVVVRGAIEFFARVIIDPVTEQARIDDVYTDESPDWHSGSLIDEDGDAVTEPIIERMVDAWAFDTPVRIEFEWSASTTDLSEHGPFCDHLNVSYDPREGWNVCDDCGKTNVNEPDEGPSAGDDDSLTPYDTMTDDERANFDAIKLASERNPDLAWTQADMDDH